MKGDSKNLFYENLFENTKCRRIKDASNNETKNKNLEHEMATRTTHGWSLVVHELEFPSCLNKRALKRYGSGYPETGKCVAGHRVPGDMVRGKVNYAANSFRGETMINASTTRLDFYLHALPALHRDNSLLYDYLTGHTCGKDQVSMCVHISPSFQR